MISSRGVTLDGFCARVPGEDMAFGVEDKDSVVLHGVDEESKRDIRLGGFVREIARPT